MSQTGSVKYEVKVRTADETREVGRKLAAALQAGDLLILSGSLGAGKTTFTQGIGAGMGVRGHVSSPTFIVARVHQPQAGTVPLIHADAYRITDLADLETLDLEATLPQAVTVIEWGAGKTEFLSEQRLEVQVLRAQGAEVKVSDGVVDLAGLDDGERTIIIEGYGPRWESVDLDGLLG